jgi:hypothetical protein
MTTLGELLNEAPARAERRTVPIRTEIRTNVTPAPVLTLRDEQIHALVHELFFGRDPGLVRNAGFTPIGTAGPTGPLCLDVAHALASMGQHDVGLIDASFDTAPLQDELQIKAPAREEVTWPVGPRLWLVPRQGWWPEADGRQPVTDRNLERLREIMTEFDFSVVCCGPASWMTARIARVCDGLVLVLRANKTRRLVAVQIKDRLEKARIPVLGSVLVERRFPVPQGLYRSL